MTKEEIMEKLCDRCEHLATFSDMVEVWGEKTMMTTTVCDLGCDDADDPECAEHDRWMRIFDVATSRCSTATSRCSAATKRSEQERHGAGYRMEDGDMDVNIQRMV